MMRALWVAKTGLDAEQTNLDVISNNLANISTYGFKRSRPIFEDLVYQNLRQPGAASTQQTYLPTGLQVGTGVRPVATERIHTQGNVQLTENQLDVAIRGKGFFQILMPDGTTAYTRDGAFQKDDQGQIVMTANGYTLQPTIVIPIDATGISIGRDGVVTVTTAGSNQVTQVGDIQIATFINPAGLESISENLYVETNSSGAPNINTPGLNGAGTLLQNYVETSNVNMAEELVNMIIAQRAFEINTKVVTTSDTMLGRLTQL